MATNKYPSYLASRLISMRTICEFGEHVLIHTSRMWRLEGRSRPARFVTNLQIESQKVQEKKTIMRFVLLM